MKLNVYPKQALDIFPGKKGNLRASSLFALLLAILVFDPIGLQAQAEMICDGSTQTIEATGVLTDMVIPMDTTIAQIEFTVHGADGGFADLGNACFSEGGAGANATARFELGDADGAIPYGSSIRFVVGIAGEKGTGGTVLGTGSTYGGGGGGTGIMYKAPDSDAWQVLMVAGGGGGAYQGSVIGICVDSKSGEGGRSGTSGGNGNGANGGEGGTVGSGGMAGGLSGFEVSGGGGGAYTIGEGITCVDLDGSTEIGEGQLGFPLGGAGGGNENCFGSTSRDGGFGFGGGAAGQGGGGGGGGFSGGGGGGSSGRGGGGGSYILNIGIDPVIEEGGLTSTTEDGFAQYRCIKSTTPPVEAPEAACVDTTVIVSLNTEGLATIVTDLINNDTINPALIYSLSATDFSCDSLGERSVILLVQDGDARADSCTAVIRIVDELAPALDCPMSVEVDCGTDTSLDMLGLATTMDNCGGADLEMSETLETGECPGNQTIIRTWTATDASDNSSSCSQLIVISDTTSPSCENCPVDVTVTCGEIPAIPEIDVSDNCDAAPAVELSVSSTQTDDGCGAYAYVETRSWTITDACGNRTVHEQLITVVDNEAPVCENCPVDITVSCGEIPAIPEIAVSDNCDAAPAVELSVSSTQTDDGCGAYAYVETRSWTITDACGNRTVHEQLITVVDNEAPVCENCPVDITVSCGEIPAIPEIAVSDNCDAAPAVELSVSSTQTDDGCGAYAYVETRSWTITDACGNRTVHEQLITVVDNEAPVCENCPVDITVSCGEIPAIPEIAVSDNCDAAPAVELSVSSTQTDDGCGAYAYVETRSWTITDACGNRTVHEQLITVVDNEAPECENCPADITVSCGEIPAIPELAVSDNCDAAPSVELSVSSTQTDDGCGAYAYVETRSWTITDACGNTIMREQVVTVIDELAPELSCPPAITVTCDNDPTEAGFPAVIDNCDAAPIITYSDTVLSGDCDWNCMIERTWMATDACGNTSNCVQSIQQSVLELMEDALAEDLNNDDAPDPLLIGRLNRHSLTVTLEGAACLLSWLPNNGGKAWPLIRTDFLVDGSDCAPDGLPIGADGKMTNPLISETLILAIKLRLDPSLGEILLTDLDCDIHPIVFQGLPRNPTIKDLYDQSNLVVGNIIGLPFVEYFASALACINGTYGLCPDENNAGNGNLAGINSTLEWTKTETPSANSIKVYPNPVRTQLWLDLSAFSGEPGQLRIYNAVGQGVLSRTLNEITAEAVPVNLGELSNGIYLLQLRIGDRMITEQIVVQRR